VSADQNWYPPCKVAVETVIACCLAVVSAPLILLLCLLVRLTSNGPGIYGQVRVGRHGKPYRIYKIRTMAHDCERVSGPKWSTAGDPRVTALGRWLRLTHLDELPQLWNVLRGEMSLVGPRPERPEFVKQLEPVVRNYGTRLTVRPGITGLAQVQLPPDEDLDGVRRKVACDEVYVRSMSPWLDLRIVLGTALKVAGMPFEVTSRLLVLPGVTRDQTAREPSESEEPVTQWQTA